MSKVYIIIVTYNAQKWIFNCISSIEEPNVNLQITVIDNGSTDETLTILKTDFPKVKVVETGKNLGFGAANNLGYKMALESNADYVYLLNQDTLSYPNTISKLIQIEKSSDDIAVVSPMHLNNDGSKMDKKFEEYITAGSCPGFISDMALGNSRKYYPIGFVNAAAWLISVETIQKLGGLFSSAFFHYGEDSNFLSRVHYYKKECVIVPDVFVHHLREERKGKMSKSFENRKLSIKKTEIMLNIGMSYKMATSQIFRYAGQQVFKGNFRGALELFSYPILHKNKIKKIRKSFTSEQIY